MSLPQQPSAFIGIYWSGMVARPAAPRPRPMRLGRRVFGAVAALVLGSGAGATFAETSSPAGVGAEGTVVSKEVTGDVVYVGKRAISVEVSRTTASSTEMLLPVNEETTLELLRSFAELKRGDTVRVRYDQTVKENIDGGDPLILKTVATTVTLVRRAPPPGTMQSKSETATE